MKRLLYSLLAAASLFCLTSCAAPPSASPGSSAAESFPAESAGSASKSSGSGASSSAPVQTNEERAKALTAQMTLEEKVGQLFFARVPDTDAAADVSAYHLGGYILFGRDTKDKTANELIQAINRYQEAARIPLLIGVDEEGGTVVRVSSNPNIRAEKFRSPQQLYAAGGMDAVVKDTHEKDILLKALGFNVNLAPVADVSTDPNDFIYDRSFGQDAQATAEYVRSVVKQMRADGMGCVLKHFPGYGNNVDTHTGIAVDKRPIEQFENSDFLPFKAGLEAGGDTVSVLVSHNIVDCLTSKADAGFPASLSPNVHISLRLMMQEVGGGGPIMTDDLAMDAVKSYAENDSVAVMAIKATNSLLIATDYRQQIPQVISAVEDGTLDENLVDFACAQVLQWKIALGLL
ncbi:putative glycoside hydrolase [Oscillibacter valericigenes Sjm18-20]|nr:putative glycoside hydrolase [Oscillibacter valericigenes Sjm18-20]